MVAQGSAAQVTRRGIRDTGFAAGRVQGGSQVALDLVREDLATRKETPRVPVQGLQRLECHVTETRDCMGPQGVSSAHIEVVPLQEQQLTDPVGVFVDQHQGGVQRRVAPGDAVQGRDLFAGDKGSPSAFVGRTLDAVQWIMGEDPSLNGLIVDVAKERKPQANGVGFGLWTTVIEAGDLKEPGVELVWGREEVDSVRSCLFEDEAQQRECGVGGNWELVADVGEEFVEARLGQGIPNLGGAFIEKVHARM